MPVPRLRYNVALFQRLQLRRLAELLLIGAVSAALLGYGVDRADVGTAYLEPFTKIRAQDEATYANGALSCAARGSWLTPRVLGRYWLTKPPLLMDLSGLAIRIFGRSLWALRLPPLAAGVCTALLLFWWARRERSLLAACAAAALLLSNSYWHILSRLCLTDILVAAFTTCAMAVLYADPTLSRARSLWCFAGCVAACVLTKSVAGLLPLFVLAVYCLLVPSEKRPSAARVALAAVASIALFAPWHIYQLIAHRQWFWADYVQVQLLGWGLHAQQQSAGESAAVFYIKRLGFLDPALAALFLIALPFLISSLRQRALVLPALLAAWFAVIAAALFANQSRNLPYAASLIPAACLIAAAYNPIFRPRGAKWGALALCAIFALKCSQPERLWGLSFGAAQPLEAVAPMRSYYSLGRSNELILVNSDDFFYATTLPLPKVRYCFRIYDTSLQNIVPHFAELGISLTVDQFEHLDQLEPMYAERLKRWRLDSTEPIGTTILAQSDDALPRLLRARPQADFYVTAPDLKILERDDAIGGTHTILALPSGGAFLLARSRPGDPGPHAVVPLPARW